MIRKDLYRQIYVSTLLDFSIISAGLEQDDIFASISIDDFSTAFDDFVLSDPNNLLIPLLFGIKESIEPMDEVIPNVENIIFETFTTTQIKNKRNFSLNEPDLTVFNSEKLINGIGSISSDYYLYRAVEKICVDVVNMKKLLNIIQNSSNDFYILLYSNIYNPIDSWTLYSYALLKYVNSNKIQLDSKLLYPNPNTINPSLNFDPLTEYVQYFDIFDVINEWQHSNDIITCFMKMYHILEYMIYRKRVVEITNGATLKGSFIRQIKAFELKNERETFLKEFKNLFPGIGIQINHTNINANHDVIAFIDKYFMKSCDFYLSTSDSVLSSFIYDVRCSIVHNKESEFHITYTNLSEYEFLIPIFRDIIEVIGLAIINEISKPTTPIKFASQNLQLYN